MSRVKHRSVGDLNASVLWNAERMIGARLDELYSHEPCVEDPEAVFELHQLRIAAKRLRYTLEVFVEACEPHPACSQSLKEATRAVERLQESLGGLHDADVLVPRLAARLAEMAKRGYGKDPRGRPVVGTRRVDYEGCLGLIQICEELSREREAHYLTFLSEWKRIRNERPFDTLREKLQALFVPPVEVAPTQSAEAPG